MFLQNSQPVIEVFLMVVLIMGIVSSRLIVRRLGVIRDSYTALNEMVATLDSSTEQVNQMFERVRHEVSQGEKRLSVLLERARNAEEDLADQQKMAREATESLAPLPGRAEAAARTLQEALEHVRAQVETLEEKAKSLETALQEAGNAAGERAGQQAGPRIKDTAGDDMAEAGMAGAGTRETTSSGATAGLAEKAKTGDESPQFSDQLSVPVPERLRSPRPYLRQRGEGAPKQAM